MAAVPNDFELSGVGLFGAAGEMLLSFLQDESAKSTTATQHSRYEFKFVFINWF
jgi:hypothetical protein